MAKARPHRITEIMSPLMRLETAAGLRSFRWLWSTSDRETGNNAGAFVLLFKRACSLLRCESRRTDPFSGGNCGEFFMD